MPSLRRRHLLGQLLLEFDIVPPKGVANRAVVRNQGLVVIDKSLDLVGFCLRQVALLFKNESNRRRAELEFLLFGVKSARCEIT